MVCGICNSNFCHFNRNMTLLAVFRNDGRPEVSAQRAFWRLVSSQQGRCQHLRLVIETVPSDYGQSETVRSW